MNILAIHDGHNASLALMQEGEITYALSEERLSRVKNQGGFPERSVKRILEEAGLAPQALDRVALCGIRAPRPEWVYKDLIMKRYRRYCDYRPSRSERMRASLSEGLPGGLVSGLRKALRPGSGQEDGDLEKKRLQPLLDLGIPMEKVLRLDHHECHAAGAYYGQGASEEAVLCMTCDGGGDGICASVSVAEKGKIGRVDTIPVGDSIAKLYALITFIMGMVPLEHEYKLMGMAPYADTGRAEEIADYLEGRFLWKGTPPKWCRRPGLPTTSYWYDLIHERIRFERFDAVAAGFQRFIERMMVRWVKGWLNETGLRRLALSGGIFMNVKMNKMLMELKEVGSIYVLPSCGDESNVFGGCYLAAIASGVDPGDLSPLGPLYLGPRYTEQEVLRAVEAFVRKGAVPVDVKRHDSLEEEVAGLLARGEIVARFEGREEFGARALGNRSILADPSRLNLIREINQMIKCRDFWMPFAGTMTELQAEQSLVNPKGVTAPYMILTFDSAGIYEDYYAATHPYDRTIRPQVLKEAWNPGYHRILTEFERLTGKRGGLLNTSFNLHGYPIVSSPEDALDVFGRSGLLHLAMGGHLIRKTQQVGRVQRQ